MKHPIFDAEWSSNQCWGIRQVFYATQWVISPHHVWVNIGKASVLFGYAALQRWRNQRWLSPNPFWKWTKLSTPLCMPSNTKMNLQDCGTIGPSTWVGGWKSWGKPGNRVDSKCTVYAHYCITLKTNIHFETGTQYMTYPYANEGA